MMKGRQRFFSVVLLLFYLTTGFVIFSSRQTLTSAITPDGKRTIENICTNGLIHTPAQKNQGGVQTHLTGFPSASLQRFMHYSYYSGELISNHLEYSRFYKYNLYSYQSHIQFSAFEIIFPFHFFL